MNWDLRYPYIASVALDDSLEEEPTGYLVAPGEYTVSMSKRVRGQTTELVGQKTFTVERLREGALPAQANASEFWAEVSEFDRASSVRAELAELVTQMVAAQAPAAAPSQPVQAR